MDEPGGLLIGRRVGGFEVVDLLGRGAFASVYRTVQVSLRREVALKVLDPIIARNPDAARRFEAEGRRVARLDHPAILPVYEAGDDDGVRYLAMRLVRGHTLADELREHTLPRDRVAHIAEVVAGALDHAHSRDIIHRDVKPSNILIEGNRLWLSDFGIAATTQTVGAYTTGAIGTPEYIAPEQLDTRSGGIDGRADFYSLGCTLYECLVGHPPFRADELLAVLHAQASQPVPSTGDVALDSFFLRALAKDRSQRYASGSEMVAALRAAIGGTVLSAPVEEAASPSPTSPPDRRRRRWSVAASIVIAGAVVAALLIATRHPSTPTAPLRPGVTGPVVVEDPAGARWRLLANWSVEGINPSADSNETVTAIKDSGARIAEIVVDANRSETAMALARRAGPYQCGTDPLPITFGGGSGAFCQLQGTDWTQPSNKAEFYAYYANTKGQSWTVLVSNRVSQLDVTVFRNSFRFEV
jgi:serine/threonine-protein kinase